LPPEFFFLSYEVLVLWEKMEMVHQFIFSSKTNVPPCHPTFVDLPVRHLSPAMSALTWLLHIYIYIYIRGVNPERVPGYWVKTWNRLRDPGFSVLDIRPRPRVPQLPGIPRVPGFTRITLVSGPGATVFVELKS